jgi:glutaminyl-tRNA synthetase
LAPGREVRLRYAYFIKCEKAIKDASGNVVELHCTYDPETKGGNNPPDGRKVKSTIHWVSAQHAIKAEVRLFESLFNKEYPEDVAEGHDYKENLNPKSLEILKNCYLEPALANAECGQYYQFERQGYFCVDSVDSNPNALVFNRTVTLKDAWAKMNKQ